MSLYNLAKTALRRRDGAVVVEFAIVALPLIFMLFAIIEIGLIFVAQIDLSNATLALARQLRTGAIVAAGKSSPGGTGATMSAANFKSAICAKMLLVSNANCMAQLQVDVRTESGFGNGQLAPNPVTASNFNNGSLCYFSGPAGSIVQFRAFYLWPLSTPLLLTALVTVTSYTSGTTTNLGNYFLLLSSGVFKIEQNNSAANVATGC